MEEKTLKTKVQVFFSYYKWYILIALFFVVFLTVMTVQMCTKEDYDISVMYAGNAIFGDKQSVGIESAFEQLGKDGEKAVLYELVIMSDDELKKAYEDGHSSSSINVEKIRKNREMLVFNGMSDEYFILMLSPNCYNTMAGNGALEKISDIGVSVDENKLYSEYGIRLKSLDFVKKSTAFSVLPADTVLCFKRISEIGATKADKLEKREHDIEIFKNLVGFKTGTSGASQTAVLPKKKERI